MQFDHSRPLSPKRVHADDGPSARGFKGALRARRTLAVQGGRATAPPSQVSPSHLPDRAFRMERTPRAAAWGGLFRNRGPLSPFQVLGEKLENVKEECPRANLMSIWNIGDHSGEDLRCRYLILPLLSYHNLTKGVTMGNSEQKTTESRALKGLSLIHI